MHGLGFIHPPLDPAQVTKVIQHLRFVAAVTGGTKRLECLCEMFVSFFKLAFGHVDVGECRRQLPRQDATFGFSVSNHGSCQQVAGLIVFAAVLCIDRQVVEYHPLGIAVTGLLRRLQAEPQCLQRGIAAAGADVYGTESMMRQCPKCGRRLLGLGLQNLGERGFSFLPAPENSRTASPLIVGPADVVRRRLHDFE